ncbi:MAG: methyltransferase domain-containing protein [Dehalococcoidia bacterium]|nr:methyltransferase domain-containing protein [Dehalococcoidia bacterium]
MPTLPDALSPGSEAALAAWAARVRANRDQAERLREPTPGDDFYAPVAASFRADPRRTDEPVLNHLRTLVQPGESWLDIGAGGGRYALALALEARELIAVEPSAGMRAVLRQAMAEEGITNVAIHDSTWPNPELNIQADVAFISHVGYDIEDLGPFLERMEMSARRLCVAVLLAEAPATPASLFWPGVHGESRELLPALPEFLVLQLARGRICDVRLFERPAPTYGTRDQLLTGMRQQLFIAPGGEKDRLLHDLIDRIATSDESGRLSIGWHAAPLGVVTWRPG